MEESEIIINGTTLSKEQSFLMRLSLAFFTIDLCVRGFGKDKKAKDMTDNFIDIAKEVVKLLNLKT